MALRASFAPLLLLLSAGWARAALLPDEENTIKVFKDASPSVVFVTNIAVRRDIFSLDAFAVPQGSGSGFIWDTEGHVVTNFHVVRGGSAFVVTLKDQTQLRAEVVGTELRKDIAVLRVKSKDKLKAIALGDSQSLQVGQKTIAIGNPFGLDNTLTTGIVSALGRQVVGIGGVTIHDMIQTDAAINPGNSGGPLLDSSGRLIGMNTMIYSQSGASAGIGFAVPVSFIRRIVPQIIKYGKVIQPGIGVSILPENMKYRLLGGVNGVVVAEIMPNSPAQRAGLRGLKADDYGKITLGDVITGIDDKPIKDYDDLYNVLDLYKIGDTVTLKTARDGRSKTYRIVLAGVL